jgi:hypothetical protein
MNGYAVLKIGKFSLMGVKDYYSRRDVEDITYGKKVVGWSLIVFGVVIALFGLAVTVRNV